MKKVESVRYTADQVWAAAAAAHRINQGYKKDNEYVWDEALNRSTVVGKRNRDIMMEFLAQPETMLPEDFEQGQTVRSWLKKDLMIRALKGRLSDFDSAVSKCLAVEDAFDSHTNRYELAVVPCLPATQQRGQDREDVDTRIRFASGGHIGQPGDKVQFQVEILSSAYSQQYGIYWVRGITQQDQPVFFSSKQTFDAGAVITVRGTVKAHKDRFTQLNRVKVLSWQNLFWDL